MFVVSLKYALLVSQLSYGHFLKLIQFYLNNTINLRHLTQCIISCYTHKMAIVCDVTSPCVTNGWKTSSEAAEPGLLAELCTCAVCACGSWTCRRKRTRVSRWISARCCWTSVSRSLRRTKWRSSTSPRDRNSSMMPPRSVANECTIHVCISRYQHSEHIHRTICLLTYHHTSTWPFSFLLPEVPLYFRSLQARSHFLATYCFAHHYCTTFLS